jgi:hypothetical protein
VIKSEICEEENGGKEIREGLSTPAIWMIHHGRSGGRHESIENSNDVQMIETITT